MTDQHRATPEDWEYIRLRAEDGVGLLNCILELRARVEALEAAQQDKLDRLIALDAADPTPDPAMTELRAGSAEAQPAGLVERVAAASTASAAICEVATWLDRFALHGSGEYAQAAKVLRQEVGRG